MTPLLVSKRTSKSSGARRFISGAAGLSRSAEETDCECGTALHENRNVDPATRLNNFKPDFIEPLFLFRLAQQADQILFPQHYLGVAAMSHRLVAVWNHDGFTVLHPLDCAFENSLVRWIDQIVGGIDRQQRGGDFFKIGSGVVIA